MNVDVTDEMVELSASEIEPNMHWPQPDEFVADWVRRWCRAALEAAEPLIREREAKAWHEGLVMAGPLAVRAFADLNPYRGQS